MESKKCSKCGEIKSVDEFMPRRDRPAGFHSACRACNRKRQQSAEIKEYHRKYNQANREAKIEYSKKYRLAHIEQVREYEKKRKKNDVVYRLRKRTSSTIANAIKKAGSSKQGESVMKYLPYTMEQLKEHLEKQFVEGMSWDNYGEWHIDHIYPQSKLPYTSMDEPNFQKCWELKNLQPLWAKENISKGDKIINE